jgi:hypothetical protein
LRIGALENYIRKIHTLMSMPIHFNPLLWFDISFIRLPDLLGANMSLIVTYFDDLLQAIVIALAEIAPSIILLLLEIGSRSHIKVPPKCNLRYL